MHNALCDIYGIDVPIFAFSHSPQVVAEVSKAGGFGVLGASRMDPQELDAALQMISQECHGKSFGIDLLIPERYIGSEEGGLALETLQQQIPEGHRDFVEGLLDQHHVPALSALHTQDSAALTARAGVTISHKHGSLLVEIAFSYPIKLIVNALGVPPTALIERAHRLGVRVGALVGAVKHALNQQKAGVDLIIAQGYEAGGHTGEIASMVLTPQVVDAVVSTPVLTAGGVASGRQMAAALALGAQGVWTGSVWLMTEEAETHPVVKEKFRAASSSDTLRSRASTGKHARQLRSAWTDAWENPANPQPLPMPLQGLLTTEARQRIEQDATQGGAGGTQLINYFVGQSVGMLKETRPAAEVLRTMSEECDATLKQMGQLASGSTGTQEVSR
jgi:NAD(P)H-dependent flavin oxidoreductase YrpB (nitropropane dioxygenase family)